MPYIRLRPFFGTGKPVSVAVGIDVAEIDDVSEVNMDYSLTIYFRQMWQGMKSAFINLSLNWTWVQIHVYHSKMQTAPSRLTLIHG